MSFNYLFKSAYKKIVILFISLFFFTQAYAIELDMENQNQALEDLSIIFYSDRENPLPQQNKIDPKKMNFSVESLKHVESYLDHIRSQDFNQLDADQQFRLILRTGAYVGETLRKNDKTTTWYWVDFETAQQINPQLFGQLNPSVETAAMLTDGQKFTLPLNKVSKYLRNGAEDSVAFYVKSSLQLAE